MFAIVLVVVVIALVIAVVVHEAGHWFAAHGLGGRHVRVKRIRWGAAVEAEFDDDAPRILFLLAGPVVSVAFGVVLVVIGGWWGVVGAVSMLFGVLTLAGSDGRQARSHWVARAQRTDRVARSGTKSNDSR